MMFWSVFNFSKENEVFFINIYSCYPCPMCLGAALWAKIDAVYYATSIREVTFKANFLKNKFLAATFGFDATNIYDIVQNPDTSNYKLERLEIEDKMKPFKTWEEKEDKINYTFL